MFIVRCGGHGGVIRVRQSGAAGNRPRRERGFNLLQYAEGKPQANQEEATDNRNDTWRKHSRVEDVFLDGHAQRHQCQAGPAVTAPKTNKNTDIRPLPSVNDPTTGR